MSTLPPVDRVGGVVPVLRRDHPHVPVANDRPGKHDGPADSDPQRGRRDSPPPSAPNPAEAELPESTTPPATPAVAPNPTFGKVVNTFALSVFVPPQPCARTNSQRICALLTGRRTFAGTFETSRRRLP